MAPDGCGGIKRSSTYMKSRNMLKKGPWTASEDMLLVEYVKKHGEGNWNALQRNSGLMRCGKSCRLRWANHLRPNLKKGAFTVEEEELIIELHAKLGNKWARMAAQLPGRTDNEIKNYWNTRLKRCHRAGLPIYPQEVVNQEQNQQYRSSIQPGLSSLLTSSHLPNPNPNSNPNPLCYFSSSLTMNPPPHQPNSSYITQELKLFNDNNSCLALSLNPTPFYNQRLSISPFYNSINFGINSELPSIQSAASSTEFVMVKQSDEAEDYEVSPRLSHHSNSGLLEDLLGESQALSGRIKAEVSFIAAAENENEKIAFSFGHVNETSESQFQGKTQKELREENDSGDDDLMNLLDNFPLAVPFPDWTEGHGYESPNLTNGTNGTMECQTEDSQYTPVAISSGAENRDGNFGPCWWNNMPTIY